MLNLKKRIAIAEKIATLPEEAKEAEAFKSLYGDLATIDDVNTVLAAIRLVNFKEIVTGIAAIPADELEQLNRRQIFERLYPDQISREDFRSVWIEERASGSGLQASGPKPKTEKKKAENAAS